MKFAVIVLLLCTLGCTQAQKDLAIGQNGKTPVAGMTSSQFFSYALQAEAQKMLRKPELPSDMVQRIMRVLADGEQGYANCTAAVVPWMQVRCSAIQMKISKSQLKAIEYEATAKSQATNMAVLMQQAALAGGVSPPIAKI